MRHILAIAAAIAMAEAQGVRVVRTENMRRREALPVPVPPLRTREPYVPVVREAAQAAIDAAAAKRARKAARRASERKA